VQDFYRRYPKRISTVRGKGIAFIACGVYKASAMSGKGEMRELWDNVACRSNAATCRNSIQCCDAISLYVTVR